MSYNIIEARIEFDGGKLSRITVLVEISKGDVRAIFASTLTGGGYLKLRTTEQVSDKLLQDVAATGCETIDRDTIFPKWKKKYKH